MSATPPLSCVLRLFSGPLQGCEFVLTQPCTLFVTGLLDQDGERSLLMSPEAIYLPHSGPGGNFEVMLPQPGATEIQVRLLGDAIEEHPLALQRVHELGGVRVALRTLEESWQPELFSSLSAKEPPSAPTLVRGSQRMPWLGLALMLVVLVAGAGGGWYALHDERVSTVESLLVGSASLLRVLPGGDGSVYVFADNERDLNWARQVLRRHGHAADQVRTAYLETQRLRALLAEHMPQLAWHRIDFSDLQHPRLWLSEQRNRPGPELDRELEALMLAAMPYARTLAIRRSDDRLLLRHAEQALQRLAIPYVQHERAGGVTFAVQGSLQDAELAALRGLVSDFHQLWGDRYVHFAVELQDDLAKGRSFQSGAAGYIKTTPSSWHFTQPQ